MIEIPKTEMLNIELLKVDVSNPNKMTEAQFEALKENIKKYGFLTPIITNKDYVIADGEHRYKAAESLGMKEIPVIVLQIKEVDRRILRQVMNKLKGTHELWADTEEFEWLKNNDGDKELLRLLAKDEDYYTEILENKNEIPIEKEYDENIELTNKCPKCGYEW